jgi:amphi-Trp domain-containing protein
VGSVVLFKSEEMKDLRSVSGFLHQLADKLAKNQVVLRQGREEIQVTIPDYVVLEVKAEQEIKKGRKQRSLEVKIQWIEGGEARGTVTLG